METRTAFSRFPSTSLTLATPGMKVRPLRNLPFTIEPVPHLKRTWIASGSGSPPTVPTPVLLEVSVQAPVNAPVALSHSRPVVAIDHDVPESSAPARAVKNVERLVRWVATAVPVSNIITDTLPGPFAVVQLTSISRGMIPQ